MAIIVSRIPFTLELLKVAVPMYKAEGNQRVAGLSKDFATFCTKQAFSKTANPLKGTLSKGETYKWLNKSERDLLNAVWESKVDSSGKGARRTRKTSGKSSTVTSKPSLTKPWADMSGKERAAHARACKQAKSGKTTPVAVKPQASGKVTNADLAKTLADVAQTLATLANALAS